MMMMMAKAQSKYQVPTHSHKYTAARSFLNQAGFKTVPVFSTTLCKCTARTVLDL